MGQGNVGRFGEGHKAEEGVNRGQPHVPAARADAAISLQIVQEAAEEGWFQNLYGYLGRWLASLLPCKLREQSESVAVASDRIGTCLHLMRQTISEEGLQEFWELEAGAHRATSLLFRAKRTPTNHMHFAVPITYHYLLPASICPR